MSDVLIVWECPICHNIHRRQKGPEHEIVSCSIEYCVVPLSKSTSLSRPYIIVLDPTACLICRRCHTAEGKIQKRLRRAVVMGVWDD